MNKLFTDSDLDGLGCGLLAKIAFGESANVAYCSYRNLNERVERFIDNPHNKQAKVYITDLAVNAHVEKKLANRFKKGSHVQMIDHHATAMHFNDHEWGFVQAEYDSGKKTCATSLYYEFLIKEKKITATKALDDFVELVRQYDTWEWEKNDNKAAKRLNDLFFILGLEHFETEMLERMKHTEGFSLSDKEELILDLEDKKIERYIFSKNRQIVQTFVDDYCVGIIYAEQYLSELGNALAKLNPHLDLIAMVNVGTRKVGFRTIYDDVDVSKFAQKYDGGGHPKASGCALYDETFSLYVEKAFPLSPIKLDAPKNEHNAKESNYLSLYSNRKGERAVIFPLEDGKWSTLDLQENVKDVFSTYAEAERSIKRKFAAGLAFDNDFFNLLTELLKKPEEQIRSNLTSSLEDAKQELLKK